MANIHHNGKKPIEMPAEEYDKQKKIWEDNNGEVRDDHPHTGANYLHSHWMDKDIPNEDFVCVRQTETPEEEPPEEETPSEESSEENGNDD